MCGTTQQRIESSIRILTKLTRKSNRRENQKTKMHFKGYKFKKPKEDEGQQNLE